MLYFLVSFIFLMTGIYIGRLSCKSEMLKNNEENEQIKNLLKEYDNLRIKLTENKNIAENNYHILYNQFMSATTYMKSLEEQMLALGVRLPENDVLRVDDILDKINKQGVESLTEEERDFLDKFMR